MLYVLAYIGAMVVVFFLMHLYTRFETLERRIAALGPVTYIREDDK